MVRPKIKVRSVKPGTPIKTKILEGISLIARSIRSANLVHYSNSSLIDVYMTQKSHDVLRYLNVQSALGIITKNRVRYITYAWVILAEFHIPSERIKIEVNINHYGNWVARQEDLP